MRIAATLAEKALRSKIHGLYTRRDPFVPLSPLRSLHLFADGHGAWLAARFIGTLKGSDPVIAGSSSRTGRASLFAKMRNTLFRIKTASTFSLLSVLLSLRRRHRRRQKPIDLVIVCDVVIALLVRKPEDQRTARRSRPDRASAVRTKAIGDLVGDRRLFGARARCRSCRQSGRTSQHLPTDCVSALRRCHRRYRRLCGVRARQFAFDQYRKR